MVIMLAYLSYLVAEHFGCSGIVAIFTCAVVMSHYAMYNVPRATRRATRHTAEVFSYLCEGAIFLYVGLDTIDPVTWEVGVFYWSGRCVLARWPDVMASGTRHHLHWEVGSLPSYTSSRALLDL